MKLLCSPSSLAFAHSLRIALDGEGIGTFCSYADSNVSGIAGPMTGSAARIYLLDEGDWDRAVEVMRRLDPSPDRADAVSAAMRGGWPRWIWIVSAAIAAALLAGILGASH